LVVKQKATSYTAWIFFRVDNVQAEYVMNDVKLDCVLDEKDLGVIVSDDVKSGKQCSEAVKKAKRTLLMIKRNFTYR